MSETDRAAQPDSNSSPEAAASALSRRSMLRGAATAGAAGLAVTAFAGPALAASRPSARTKATAEADHDAIDDQLADGEDVVVHVRDVRSGEMDVYRGTSHTRVQDRALAARLARASQ